MTAIEYGKIVNDRYDQCYQTGNYTDQDCENCPHKYDCSGYEGDDNNE